MLFFTVVFQLLIFQVANLQNLHDLKNKSSLFFIFQPNVLPLVFDYTETPLRFYRINPLNLLKISFDFTEMPSPQR